MGYLTSTAEIIRARSTAARAWITHYWLAITISGATGALLSLLIRLPLLPPPGEYVQTLITTFAGASGGAAVTVLGALWVARRLKQEETQNVIRSMAHGLSQNTRTIRSIFKSVPDFPKLPTGDYNKDAVLNISPATWQDVLATLRNLRLYCQISLDDIGALRPHSVGVTEENRIMIGRVEHAVRRLVDYLELDIPEAKKYADSRTDSPMDGMSMWFYQRIGQQLDEVCRLFSR